MTARPQNMPLSALRDAARFRGQTIGLYGGSFNPVHKGHFHVAKEALKRLDIDAVWMMVSPGNPLKIKDNMPMVPADERLDHARKILKPSQKIFITDIETRLGTRYSADTITELLKLMPQTRFVWLMGADNMAGFFRWKDWQRIIGRVPIAIFDRPEYTTTGLSSRLAQCLRHRRVSPARLTKDIPLPAWTFIRLPRHRGSATVIRSQLGQIWTEDNQIKEI